MGTIVVKNLPDHLHALLKQRAEHNHRSMTKEVVHLIEAGLDGALSPPDRPLPPAASSRDSSPPPSPAADGREALRAALIEQADGSYVNVLGIEDAAFFETLARIRSEARSPDVSNLFDDA